MIKTIPAENVLSAKVVKNVKEKIRTCRQRLPRKLAKELNISRRTVRNILKYDIGLTSNKKKR